MVGLWSRAVFEQEYAVTLRQADGRFRRKANLEYDLFKPPIRYEESGRWWIKEDKYVEVCDSISAGIFRDSLGRKVTRPIITMSNKVFKYTTPDGGDEEDLRIGDASLAEFERTALKPLPREKQTGTALRAIPVSDQR